MFHTYIDWRHWFWYEVWPWVWRGSVIGLAILGLWITLSGCSGTPEVVQATPVPAFEFQDPLAIDYRQKESVARIVGKLGAPEIPFAWAGDDFKVEVLKWKVLNSNLERWAIRINDVYKFTWTQWKETPKK